jgi:hypothetical protein
VTSSFLVRPPPLHLFAFALLAAVVGCRSDDPFRIAAVQLGSSLNADKTVARQTTTFAPGDTVHLAVITEGLGSGTVSVRWWLADRLVSERQEVVSSRDTKVTEFHLQSTGPFPIGPYRVEIRLDGKLFDTRAFRVAKPQ